MASGRAAVRVFVAVRPEASTRARLAALVPAGRGVRPVPAGQLHATLRFLADVDPAAVAAALDRTQLPPTDAVLGPATRCLRPGLLVVPVAGLGRLAAVVRAATVGLGAPPNRPFLGHVTLARSRGDLRPDAGAPVEEDLIVRAVEVVASRTGPHGAVHDVVARLRTR